MRNEEEARRLLEAAVGTFETNPEGIPIPLRHEASIAAERLRRPTAVSP